MGRGLIREAVSGAKLILQSFLKLFLATPVINTYPVSSITLILLYLPSFLTKKKKRRNERKKRDNLLLTFPGKIKKKGTNFQ